jgi:hypothetical protein
VREETGNGDGRCGVQELYLRKQVSVRIGEPLRVEIGGLGHHQGIDAVVERVAGALRRLQPPHQGPRPAVKLMRFLSNLLDVGLIKPVDRRGDLADAPE